MIGVRLELQGDSKRELSRLEREAPRLFRAAHGAAARRARNRLRKVMSAGGGMYGVPKLADRHEMTLLLRPGSKLGGKLAEKSVIVMGRLGNGQWIGWPDRLAEWASGWQGAQRKPMLDSQKWALHRRCRALNGYHIPDFYNRPARMVIDPCAEQLAKDFPELVAEMYGKYMKNALKKGRAIT